MIRYPWLTTRKSSAGIYASMRTALDGTRICANHMEITPHPRKEAVDKERLNLGA